MGMAFGCRRSPIDTNIVIIPARSRFHTVLEILPPIRAMFNGLVARRPTAGSRLDGVALTISPIEPTWIVKTLEIDGATVHQIPMLKLIPNIPVADVERSVEFYRQLLGFDLLAVRGRGDVTRAHLKRGDVEIIFRSLDVYAPLPYLDPALENQLMLHIQVNDIVDLYHRIKDEVRVVRSLEPTLFGSAEFMIRDVDGRVLVFSQATGSTAPSATEAGRGSGTIDAG